MSKKQIGDLQIRLRLRWIQHYEQVTKKVAPTCRYFGISRGTFYLWYHRYLSMGADGLRDKSSRPHKIKRWLPKEIRDTIIQLRLQRKYGPDRMEYYIRRKYNWFVSSQTIWRLYKEHGLNQLKYKKKWQRYPQRYSKAIPGDRVQIDDKYPRAYARGFSYPSASFACPVSSCPCCSMYSLIIFSLTPTVETK